MEELKLRTPYLHHFFLSLLCQIKIRFGFIIVVGHPSFNVLKLMFPSLFKGFDLESFHCNDCEFAKHKRASFQKSNTKTLNPFSLIHSDIWGPSTIPNISSARWFVSFVDDCTQVTWICLLKNKYDVGLVFPNFYNMIKT